MLEVRGLSAGYLGEDVVHSIDFEVESGEVVTIIGSNGAGKTTLFRAICGLGPTSTGTVTFQGQTITGWAAHRVSRRGLAYVPAERKLFPQMTVRENLGLGAFPRSPDSDTMAFVFDLFPQLAERQTQHAGTMSGGEQQMLAVGRALMSQPRLLMLDEPSTGLAPKLAQGAYAALEVLRSRGMTLLIAEQQVPLALALADRGYVVENGLIQMTGTSRELENDPDVRRAYLGVA